MTSIPEAVLGSSEGDAVLAALGVRRLAIPVPFPQAGGPVNVYLIDNPDGTLTLFDSGIYTPEAQQALEAGFAQAGRRLEEVRRILISHGHIDHYGLARLIVERSGAEVLIHPRDAKKVLESEKPVGRTTGPWRAYLEKLGVPASDIEEMGVYNKATQRFGLKLPKVGALEEGQRFRFAKFEAQVLHMPGHTPGLVVLWAPELKLVLSDDHVLARVSPNPLLELGEKGEEDKFRALESYLASARRLYEMELDWVLPGHGAPFQGHRPLLDSLLHFYERRQSKILQAMQVGPRTANELVHDVFGRAEPLQLFLMLSEIVGNLEVLESRRIVGRVPGVEPYRWQVLS